MTVVDCDVPAGSALGKDLIERADYRDAYRVPLRRPDLPVIDIFFGIFAHRPAWMSGMLIARNKAARLVAGRDNKHMDFRLSIKKVRDDGSPSVVVSTLCMVHNAFGRLYLAAVIPFHKFGLRQLMARAVAAQRL